MGHGSPVRSPARYRGRSAPRRPPADPGTMHMRRTGQLVALDRHPLVVYLLALCVLSGVASLLSPSPNAPHVPVWVNRAWYLLLVAGGLTALTGAFWRDALTGVLVVR